MTTTEAAAILGIGDRVVMPDAEPDWPSYRRTGTIVKVTKSSKYGHVYYHIAWWPNARYPQDTFRNFGGRGLVRVDDNDRKAWTG